MFKRTSDPLADGLGVKQDMPPAQVQAVRQRYGMPHNFIDGFPISSLTHMNNHGKFKRDIDFGSIHRTKEQQQTAIQKQPTLQQQQSTLQSQLLRQQLSQPAQQPTQQRPKPNYAGQYVKPPKVDQRRIDLEPKTQPSQYQQPRSNQNHLQHQQQLQQQKLANERKLKNLQREQRIVQLKRKIRQEEQGMGR